MTQQVQSLLSDLSESLVDRDFEQAETLVTELQNEYDSQQAETRQHLSQSHALLTNGEPRDVDDTLTLNALWREDSTTRITRSLMLIMATTVVEAHGELEEEGDLETAIDATQAAIEDLINAESQFAETYSSTQTIVDNAEVPPTISISSVATTDIVLSPGEQTTVDISVENVGASTATAVSLDLTLSDGLEANSEQFAIGSVPSQQTVEQTVQITATNTDSQAVEISVNSENAGSDSSIVSITVRNLNTDTHSGIALSPEELAGLGIGSIGVLYLASRMLSDDEDDEYPPPPQ